MSTRLRRLRERIGAVPMTCRELVVASERAGLRARFGQVFEVRPTDQSCTAAATWRACSTDKGSVQSRIARALGMSSWPDSSATTVSGSRCTNATASSKCDPAVNGDHDNAAAISSAAYLPPSICCRNPLKWAIARTIRAGKTDCSR